MRSCKRVARAGDWLIDINQTPWERSRNIIRSPEVRDLRFQPVGYAEALRNLRSQTRRERSRVCSRTTVDTRYMDDGVIAWRLRVQRKNCCMHAAIIRGKCSFSRLRDGESRIRQEDIST